MVFICGSLWVRLIKDLNHLIVLFYNKRIMFKGISDQVWSNYFSKIEMKSLTILPVLLHPRSRGTVRLASKEPSIPPLIDPQYLTDSEDIEVLISGIELIKGLIKTRDFQLLGADFNTNIFPGKLFMYFLHF